MQNKYKKNSGFTLIELLVVVGIIGILSAISVSTFKEYKAKAERAKLSARIVQEKKIYEAACVGKKKFNCAAEIELIRKPGAYSHTPKQCESWCESLPDSPRLATVEELFWAAEKHISHCAWSWAYNDNSAQEVSQVYPMYIPYATNSCGPIQATVKPRLITLVNSTIIASTSAQEAITRSRIYDREETVIPRSCICAKYPKF